MKHYEYTYLTRQDMAEEAAKKLQDQITGVITAQNGTITELPKAYKKRLAYRVKKQEAAYVNTVLFQSEPAVAVSLKKETDTYPEILRGLIISYNPEKLKREPRRERPAFDPKPIESEIIAAKVATPEKPRMIEEKEPQKEIKEKEPEKETKEAKEEKKEVKKTAKPDAAKDPEKKEEEEKPKTRRRTKIKAELRDIEEKLDEILK